ncbi:MAG TPA: glycosyltransferase [Pelagibacteraceae bacterium]|jgi:glycosyltransferase involved in cell wall biosynthesis|nr:glycosyltransferase [Pelagibacteraceae bacterium]|tara:strand:- start:1681 stop:2568 length:888 start_codon:yes stop_codon:yes gene_type:complete
MKRFVILIPLYNDWKSVFKLLKNIDLQITEWNASVSVLIVNDASIEKKPKTELNFKNIKSARIISMKNNQGHARCYAAGLKFLTEKENFDYVILMDGDGEDRPEELSLLFKKTSDYPLKTVTANRIRRSEGPLFKLMYECHKILTYVFTGHLIKFGNYSCLPKEAAAKLVKEACVWSSFSGSVSKIIHDRVSISSIRGRRYFGPSQMSFFNLLIHSFSIIAVFKGSVIVRSVLFLIFYLFFVFSNLSVITFFPVLAVLFFLLLVLRTSSRENIEELNSSLENIGSIDVLGNSNNR